MTRLAFSVCLLLCSMPCMADESRTGFVFGQWEGPELQVFVTRPPGLTPDRPVIFVMHGMRRNAEEYRDQWHEQALAHNFLLLVPEFSLEDFPASRHYNLGNVVDEKGRKTDPATWSFNAIEKIFDDARQRFGMAAESYSLYGHSAGSQFVHRFLMFVPDARVARVVAANAGWYTLPDFSVEFPYGLKGSAVTPRRLVRALDTPLTILLGDQDTDPNEENLRRTPEALVQGPHRLARGYYFFASGRLNAKKLDAMIRWKLAVVEGVAHDNSRIAQVAVQFLLPE